MSGHDDNCMGTCHVFLAYDLGAAIRLEDAARRIEASAPGACAMASDRARAPRYFQFNPQPLRLALEATPVRFGRFGTQAGVEVLLYDFGAASLRYRFALQGSLEELLELSEALYENAPLLADSRQHVQRLLTLLGPAVERPAIRPEVEDYVVMHLDEPAAGQLGAGNEHLMAQILRSQRRSLAADEVRDAMSCTIAFAPEDQALIDWNAALLFGPGLEDTRAVLEYVNVQLLEMRIIDSQLDRALDQAYTVLSRGRPPLFRVPGVLERDAAAIAQLQVDSALLFERVVNSLKLVGDQYLARVYRLASQRFHLQSWDAAIQRKLQALENIYAKMNDRTATRRMELLELVIIVLIAIEVVRSFW